MKREEINGSKLYLGSPELSFTIISWYAIWSFIVNFCCILVAYAFERDTEIRGGV